jgi:hypothetical protein
VDVEAVVEGMEANGVSLCLAETSWRIQIYHYPQIQRTPLVNRTMVLPPSGAVWQAQQPKSRVQRQPFAPGNQSHRSSVVYESDSAHEVGAMLGNGLPAARQPTNRNISADTSTSFASAHSRQTHMRTLHDLYVGILSLTMSQQTRCRPPAVSARRMFSARQEGCDDWTGHNKIPDTYVYAICSVVGIIQDADTDVPQEIETVRAEKQGILCRYPSISTNSSVLLVLDVLSDSD